MEIRRAELAHFGIASEQYDEFFEQIAALKQEVDTKTFVLSGDWICTALRICPHVLAEMIDAGVFPAPVVND